jgi:hypothetical protein
MYSYSWKTSLPSLRVLLLQRHMTETNMCTVGLCYMILAHTAGTGLQASKVLARTFPVQLLKQNLKALLTLYWNGSEVNSAANYC